MVWLRGRSAPTGSDRRQLILPGLSQGPKAATPPAEVALQCARGRLLLGAALLGLGFMAIVFRLVTVTVGQPWGEPASKTSSVEARDWLRADITDRHGFVLATTLPTVSLCADTKQILTVEDTLKGVKGIFPDIDPARLEKDLAKGGRCVMLRRHLTPAQQKQVNNLGLPGLEFLHDARRVYPTGALTAHMTGYTDIDGHGLAGLERGLDKTLTQENAAVVTSIDIRLQQLLHHQLETTMKKFRAIGAAGAVMDIKTGEILALSSLPTFDPHQPGQASAEAKFNRATLGVYELGSVFKLFTVAAALDRGVIKPSQSFDATKPLQVGKYRISDFHPENRWMNVPETLVYSSNIATAQIADRLGAQKLHSSFDALGLLKPATLEIPEIGKPLVPPTPWKNITTMTAAYGHGLAVSPLQILGGLAALSGQGQFVAPTLLHKKRVAAGETVFKPETVQRMRALMRLVVTHGTAKSAEAKGYMVAGKTGTAEKVTAKGYDKNSRIASFAGVFPIHAPRYALFVMFDNPQGTKETYGFATAGWVAAPAAGDIIARAAPVLGLAPLDAEDEAIAEQILFKPIQSLVAGLPKDNTVSPVHKETEIHKETKTQKPQDTHAPVTTASAR